MATYPSLPLFDVLIIGGGLSGLSAALSLARTLHSTVVFDSGVYRNDRANWMHQIPTWDSQDPKTYREAARANLLAKYDRVQFADVAVEKIEKVIKDGESTGLFCVTDMQQRQWLGRKIILATGVRDILLDIPGYEDCWMKGGIFHCMVHRGYEERGCDSAGVLSAGGDANLKAAMHIGAQARNITPKVTIYAHGNEGLKAECEEAMSHLGFQVEGRRIKSLTKALDRAQVTIEFDDGELRTEGFLVHRPLTQLNGDFAEQLSLETTEMGFLKTSPPFFETTVPSVFAVGDCAAPFKIGPHAIATGSFGAAGAQMQLNSAAVQPRANEVVG